MKSAFKDDRSFCNLLSLRFSLTESDLVDGINGVYHSHVSLCHFDLHGHFLDDIPQVIKQVYKALVCVINEKLSMASHTTLA